MTKPTQERIDELEKQRDHLQRLLDCERAAPGATPRWVADMKTLELSERQNDNSYRPAYKMVPL
jgi:hypothetical protein